MRKNKISKNWLIKRKKDQFFKQSQIQGYRARSAFKLIEINEKFKFIKKNTFLLDLGSSPGSWSQVVAKKINMGKILAVDIRTMEKINNVDFIKGDFLDVKIHNKIYAYFDKKIANFLGIKILFNEYVGILLTIKMDVTKIATELKTV